ncbi:putative membrane protein [Mycolicibacterium lutetiense]|uniref:Membrane protein n=2 Tax=Mycolicibacterium lutetiense TaxID=1641992 RepID=A0ABS5A2T3_9MYCO|nr:putative membrane protein [Mycolicibacterium lutetiense]
MFDLDTDKIGDVMVVFLTLMLGSAAARAIGLLGVDYLDSWPEAIAVGLAAMFALTGIAHFVNPLRRDMIAIVPPTLPAPSTLVTVTGVLELAGAAGLLYPPTRVAAAVCLFLLMLAMFPANVYAARMPNPPKSMASRLSVRTAEEAVYLAAAVVVAVGGS